MQSVPSWDLFLIVFFIVSIGYSFVLQREKVVTTMLAIYAGLVLANLLSQPLGSFFNGDKTVSNQLFIHANASPFSIQTAIFLIVTILISIRSGLNSKGGGRGAMSAIELGVFSFLNSALILACIFSFLTPAAQLQLETTSKIAHIIIGHSIWWFVAPIIALVAVGGMKSGSSRDY